uniref:Uncharacterized protein n=1 Tax=Oryza punctata TaxID=4537 RepID=A0A0E0K374_ORYPU
MDEATAAGEGPTGLGQKRSGICLRRLPFPQLRRVLRLRLPLLCASSSSPLMAWRGAPRFVASPSTALAPSPDPASGATRPSPATRGPRRRVISKVPVEKNGMVTLNAQNVYETWIAKLTLDSEIRQYTIDEHAEKLHGNRFRCMSLEVYNVSRHQLMFSLKVKASRIIEHSLQPTGHQFLVMLALVIWWQWHSEISGFWSNSQMDFSGKPKREHTWKLFAIFLENGLEPDLYIQKGCTQPRNLIPLRSMYVSYAKRMESKAAKRYQGKPNRDRANRFF